MREYSKVSPLFWTGETGKKIRALGHECQVVALYLLTCPSANMIGLYYLPIPIIAHETGSPLEGACKALARLSEADFCVYDEASELVWVKEMAKYQIGATLAPSDKRIPGVKRILSELPKSCLINKFRDHYAAWLGTEPKVESQVKDKPLRRALQAPSKPLRSQEQEQEQEKEQDQESEQERAVRAAEVFARWRAISGEHGVLQTIIGSPKDVEIATILAQSYPLDDLAKAMRLFFTSGEFPISKQSLGMFRANVAQLVARGKPRKVETGYDYIKTWKCAECGGRHQAPERYQGQCLDKLKAAGQYA